MNSRFKAIIYTQNKETIKPIKRLLWIDDIVDEHDLTKPYMDSKIKDSKSMIWTKLKVQ